MSDIAQSILGSIYVYNQQIPDYSQIQSITSQDLPNRQSAANQLLGSASNISEFKKKYYDFIDQSLPHNHWLWVFLTLEQRYLQLRSYIRAHHTSTNEIIQQFENLHIQPPKEYQQYTVTQWEQYLDQQFVNQMKDLLNNVPNQVKPLIKKQLVYYTNNLSQRSSDSTSTDQSPKLDLVDIYRWESDYYQQQSYNPHPDIEVLSFFSKLKLFLYNLQITTSINETQQLENLLVKYH